TLKLAQLVSETLHLSIKFNDIRSLLKLELCLGGERLPKLWVPVDSHAAPVLYMLMTAGNAKVGGRAIYFR
ncbi:hypothetical protein AnigIFM49718_006378, partial [Aspergillus niger]